MSCFEWHELTRNHHVGALDGNNVCSVVRHQRHRVDGTKHDWRIEVLDSEFRFCKTFCNYDPRDLDSAKQAAEARTKWAIEIIYRALNGKGGAT